MSMFSKKQTTKKFIIILVLLMLLKFVLPLSVKADETIFGGSTIKDYSDNNPYNYTTSNQSKEGGFFDIGTNFTKLLFLGERAIIGAFNNIFCDDGHKFSYGIEGENIVVENLNLTPENIIKGSFVLFDADIFKNITDTSKYFDAGKTGTVNGKIELRNTVAGWYYALRNFAIVALLSVLVYVGIRMITSTISQDKAKYKVMLKDWLVALCLVVVMHYIMITILNLSGMITDAIAGPGGSASSQTESLMQKIGTITEADKSYTVTYDGKAHDDVRAIMVDGNGKLELYDIGDALAFMLLLLVIIFYTGLFAVKYLKREFTIIFLILLAPISAVTYPIDKIADGKAQAFNKWFYEFLYNVIIQPFHLLIYIVLVGSATQLANDNILYSIICFAVMIPAEKFIKEMFGFRDKLGTPLGAFTSGAIASQLFNKAKGGSTSKSNGSAQKDNSSELPAKVKNVEGLPGAGNANNTGDAQPTNTGNSEISGSEDDAQLDGGDSQVGSVDENAGQEGEIGEGANENDIESIESGDEETTTNNNDDKEKGDAFSKARKAMKDKYDRRLLQKYGTTKKGKLAGKRVWRAGKGVTKFMGRRIKGAVTLGTRLAGAVALGTVGAMIGRGKEGAALGIALGGKIGNAAGNLADKTASTIGDYSGTAWNAAWNRSSQKEKYKSNSNNIDRARRNIKERKGEFGTHKELENELDNMFKMQQYGVKDAFLDESMDQYNELVKGGMNEEDALNSSIISSLMAQDYSADKMRDPKAMQKLYDDYYGRYIKAGVDANKADELTRNLIQNAGKMRGVQNVALPPKKLPSSIGSQMLNARGISKPTKNQIERAEQVHIKLKDAGYDQGQIQQIMNDMNFDDNISETEFTRKLQVYVDYEKNEKEMGAITEFLGDKATDGDIRQEFIERIEVQNVFGLEGKGNNSRVTAIRAYEKNNGNKKNRDLAKRMIDGDISKKEIDETNISDKVTASYYKELVNGNAKAMRNELQMYGEKKAK